MKKIKEGKEIKWKLRFGSSCRYRDWDRGPGGFYVWGVEEEIISTLKWNAKARSVVLCY